MASEAPPFWWGRSDWRAGLLYPLSAAYGFVATHRLENARREKTGVPVLCVGNLTVGGAGKTPVAIAMANQARAMGLTPGFLSRGHGGRLSSRPHLVDPAHDSARSTGDEPLLLARHALTAVSPDRAAAARVLVGEGCDFLVMDDGFQSARIHHDYALLVVDARRGIGNGHIIPGGPMRAPLIAQLRRADAVLKMGEGNGADRVVRMASRAGRQVFEAVVRPMQGSGVEGKRLLAFAGIGDPEKFFATVASAGGLVTVSRPFPDHHHYSDEDLADLLAQAKAAGLHLVTTAKDAVRIHHGSPVAEAVLAALHVVEIETVFSPENVPEVIVEATLEAFRMRSERSR
ncbi:MAG: tetraacyldisaccharide 4'-kinase [Mesorhizobium sp.]|nr:tetraacyldisaccharide 4'-kinase [Mesorhizobium sp.]